ncbi:MAG TPA: hypothetical protein VID77_10275 [Stellaceae bacterium]|jgi:uncharacterized membrane protein|nr:hypothetical protein [Stellaceae bacterium]
MIFAVLVVSSILAAFGQMLFKWGAAGNGSLFAYANPYILGGFVFYGLSTVLWLWALSVEKLSVVFPFSALTLVLIYGISYFVLKEDIGGRELLGALLILGGLIVIAWR